jgi:twitching motility protein PilT
MRFIGDQPMTGDLLRSYLEEVLTDRHKDEFRRFGATDIAVELPGCGRFRCNCFNQCGEIGFVFRAIKHDIPSFKDLNLPVEPLKRLASMKRGLILATGVAGSGKSTTLASMIEYVNRNMNKHVITIEDPIEFRFEDKRSIINQREIGVDTRSFAYALRSALRQDPDVILVGEMRDMETIETALHAAETGHLVFSTLHTLDATETINRIISVFPPHQQKQIRLQLSAVLKAALSQRLIPRKDGRGRVPAVEVLIATPFIKDCIVDKEKTHLIQGAIAQGTSQYGMQTFDQSIFHQFSSGLISLEEALRWASNVDEFKLKVQGISTTADTAREQMANTMFSAPATKAPARGPRPAPAPAAAKAGPPEITRFGK